MWHSTSGVIPNDVIKLLKDFDLIQLYTCSKKPTNTVLFLRPVVPQQCSSAELWNLVPSAIGSPIYYRTSYNLTWETETFAIKVSLNKWTNKQKRYLLVTWRACFTDRRWNVEIRSSRTICSCTITCCRHEICKNWKQNYINSCSYYIEELN